MVWASLCVSDRAPAAPTVTLELNRAEVETYKFAEVVVKVKGSEAKNPFINASVRGSFTLEGGASVSVNGFCDEADGSIHRIRFMPTTAGTYSYTLSYQEGSFAQTFNGKFIAKASARKGLLRVDPANPYHFIWAGTGEHYFWNGTTAYYMLGWEDESVIQKALHRLADLKVNRIRVALCGRTDSGERWHEPSVVPTEKFKFRLNPWVAARPDSLKDPGFDTSKFNLSLWQRCDRLVHYARRLDIVVSIVFYLDGGDEGVDPFGKDHAAGEQEKRYYAYAASRLGAYSNVVWDLGNEYHLMRDDGWANTMGDYLKLCDPYDHLISVHGKEDFHFRTAGWASYCLYQAWDESGGHDFMLKNRMEQAQTGQPKPQINEEYGYEDHYPKGWGGDLVAPARSADNRRRLAWGMAMAGGYQTTGERANQGTGKPPDTGGGWINGRGDDQMVMLQGYAKMVEFFTSFEWWKTNPTTEVVKDGTAWCLAELGKTYALYLPKGGSIKVALPDGKFSAELFDCQTGERKPLGDLPGGEWTSPAQAPEKDWAILIRG